MPVSCSFGSSKPVYILVGPKKEPFMIHSKLLAFQSLPLKKLVCGPMKEATEGVAEWPEVDRDTFIRFSQWVYTGDYDGEVSKLVIPAPPPSPLATVEAPAAKVGPLPQDTSPPAKRAKLAGVSPGEQIDRISEERRLRFGIGPSPAAKETTGAEAKLRDYSGVLLSHARVYVLADYYNIPWLISASTTKLKDSLDGFLESFPPSTKQHDMAIENFVELLEYSYANTVDKSGKQDLLRKVITTYAARWAGKLKPHKEFQRVLDRFGELGKDIIGELVDNNSSFKSKGK